MRQRGGIVLAPIWPDGGWFSIVVEGIVMLFLSLWVSVSGL